MLAAVELNWTPLDVAGVGDRDHHVLLGDVIYQVQPLDIPDNLRAPAVSILFLEFYELLTHDTHQQAFIFQNFQQPGDLIKNLAVLL